MLSLTILNLEIIVNTNGGEFSVSIPFQEGLNVIRAENSSGKSTCMNAIAYGLGLETILGPGSKKYFPRSLYEQISKYRKTDVNEEKVYFVNSSFIKVTIKNYEGSPAVLKRDVQGNKDVITVTVDNSSEDYFLGSMGSIGIGSAKSEKGFHNWLEKFMGWSLPEVVTYEGKLTKLYLECIFPLFFIEQKRGWSEIQANIPSNWKIQNVKRLATEFCLGINRFEYENKLNNLKSEISSLENKWNNLQVMIENTALLHSVKVDVIKELREEKNNSLIQFYYIENESELSLHNKEIALTRHIAEIASEVESNTISNDKVDYQLNLVRSLRSKLESCATSKELVLMSQADIDKKLKTLSSDLNQYQQLKKLKQVGSKLADQMSTDKCPLCESDLDDTLSVNTTDRRPMTLEENIDFLDNQIKFYKSIHHKNISEIDKYVEQNNLLKLELSKEEFTLEQLKEEINSLHGEVKILLREKIESEMALNQVKRLKAISDELNESARKIRTSWGIASGALKELRKSNSNDSSALIILKLQSLVKANLVEFGFNSASIGLVSISTQTLRPEEEGYDIVAETSASDYIRIIWAYTLALLQLAGSEKSVKHGGFVVFDEPRQHEANPASFAALTLKAQETSKFNGQVIFATSIDKQIIHEITHGKGINVVYYDDYILSQVVEVSES